MENKEIYNRCKYYIYNVVMVDSGITFIIDELVEDLLISDK